MKTPRQYLKQLITCTDAEISNAPQKRAREVKAMLAIKPLKAWLEAYPAATPRQVCKIIRSNRGRIRYMWHVCRTPEYQKKELNQILEHYGNQQPHSRRKSA